MGMTIDEAMNNLNGILTETAEDEDSVCYVTKDDAETLQVAIDNMRKYQKIEQIVSDFRKYQKGITWGFGGEKYMQMVSEVVEDGNGVSEVRI